jgi:putative peptidoglycan lipid II flippase
MLTRRLIIKKTLHVMGSTLMSRFLGLIREIIQVRFLGVGPISDAFVTAFAIPNSLRKIFAEGAMSAAFVPTIVKVSHQENKKEASKLVTLIFLVLQSVLILLCITMFINADAVIRFAAPGWFKNNAFADQTIIVAHNLFRLLIFFIVTISASSLLAGALQAVSHFTVPAVGQIVMNIGVIVTLILCIGYNTSVYVYAVGILASALIVMGLHVWAYKREGFTFAKPDTHTWYEFKYALKKFFSCLISLGALEINLFIDRQLASYLPSGSATLLYYTYSFMRLPLAMLVTAFATIMLPQVTRVGVDAPRRLSFYVHEVIKLALWIMIPLSFVMHFFSFKIFSTVMLSENFTLEHARQAGALLNIFMNGLLFFSLNRLLLNFYYALHVTLLPTLITLLGTVLNTVLNIILMRSMGVNGIAWATTSAAAVQTILLMAMLYRKFDFIFYRKRFMQFVRGCSLQFLIAGLLFYSFYTVLVGTIHLLSAYWQHLLLDTIVLWMWVFPLCGFLVLGMYFTRKTFGIRLYFLE